MNELERFEKLAAIARGESAPALDVADAVLSKLLSYGAPEKALAFPIAVCAVAATVLAAFAVNSWFAMADPLLDFLNPIVQVLQ